MKKIKNNKPKEEFTKHELMFPDLTQLKLEKAQLRTHIKTTNHIGNILQVLLILANKIKNIETILLKRENKNGKKQRQH